MLPEAFYPDDAVIWSRESGVTYSMLCRWMVCPERARLAIYYGLREKHPISQPIAFGDVVDIFVEHFHADTANPDKAKKIAGNKANEYLKEGVLSVDDLCKIKATTDAYVAMYGELDTHWRQQEFTQAEFYVKVPLPSGREIFLRGKIDELFVQLFQDETPSKLTLCDLKTKGDFVEDHFNTGLTFDLQLNLYLLILETLGYNVEALQYDVVRRVGGMGCPVATRRRTGRGKAKVGAESPQEFSDRLYNDILNNREAIFLRVNKAVSKDSIEYFRKVSLYPLLERFLDWTAWLELNWDDPFKYVGTMPSRRFRLDPKNNPLPLPEDQEELTYNCYHWMRPMGVYDPIASGWGGDLTEFLLQNNRNNLIIKPNYSELHHLSEPHLTNVTTTKEKNAVQKSRNRTENSNS